MVELKQKADPVLDQPDESYLAEKYPAPVYRPRPVGTIFFIIIHLIGIIGTPLYAYFHGISAAQWLLFGSYFVLTGMAITVGYHRYFSHATFKTNAFIKFWLLFFGGATFEQSALKWSSQHRQHHNFADTDRDPYNINKGFWYAHVLWILFYKHKVNYDNVKDLMQSKLIMHQHKRYGLWSVLSGMVIPMAIGTAMGEPGGTFVMTICLRLTLVLNAAFFINSFAHTFGTKPYDKTQRAADHWLGAIITNGEGYHNFHHRFPNDYRNGIKWYHWDPSKWIIFLFSKVGLAWDLNRTPKERIQRALDQTAASSV